MRRTSILVLAGAMSAAGVVAQTQTQSLPNAWLNTDANGSSAWPVNQATDHKWQWHYDSGQFLTQGPITITEIYVRAVNATATVAAFGFPSFVVTLSSSLTDYSVAGSGGLPGHSSTFAGNVGPDATVVKTGPWSGGPVPPSGGPAATWIPFGLTGSFTYDASLGRDFLLQIEKCGGGVIWGASIDGPSGGAGTIFGNRYGVNSSCVAAVSTLQNNEFVPVVRIDYVPGTLAAEYQVNQPGASADINGILGGTLSPATVHLGIGQTGAATLASVSIGVPWEVAIGTLPLVGRSTGGLTTSDGQVINIDVTDPSLVFLWSLFASPPFANSQLALSFGAPASLSFQMAVLSPTAPSGFSLSQPVRLLVP